MPLPTSLPGSQPPTTNYDETCQCGPWKVGSTFYALAHDATNLNQLNMYSSTDPTTSWTEEDQYTHSGSGVRSFSAIVRNDGTTIAIAAADIDDRGEVEFVEYNTTTDTFGTPENVHSESMHQTSGYKVSIVETSGNVIYVISHFRTFNMGTAYRPLYFHKTEGTWSSGAITADSGPYASEPCNGAVIDADGKIHCFYLSSSNIVHRSINTASSDSLSSEETVDSNADSTEEGRPLVYSSGGTERVTHIYRETNANDLYTSEIDDDGSPSTPEDADDATNTQSNPVLVNNGTDLYWIALEATSRDVWMAKNSDSAGWGSATEENTSGGRDDLLLFTGRVIDRSGTKIGFFYSGTSAVEYDEIDIGKVLEHPASGIWGFYDDGTEAASTLMTGGLDTDITAGDEAGTDVDFATAFFVRFQVNNSGADGALLAKLQYSYNSGAWTDVPTSGAPVIMATSGNVADSDATTNRMTGGSGTFVAGEVAETDNTADSVTITSGNHTEILWVIQVVAAQVSDTDTIELRVVESDNTLLTGWVAADAGQITIDKIAAATSIQDIIGGLGVIPFAR